MARTMEVSIAVREVLDRSVIDGPTLVLPGERLARDLYVAVNKVIEAAGGKWDRKRGAHVFDGEAADVIEPILLSGRYGSARQDFGQFDTPREIVARLMELAQVAPGMDVLEPSAGVGNIVAGIVKVGGIPHAFEIDDKRRAQLINRGLMQFPVARGDFLTCEPTPAFDRVVMNPPFAKHADIDHVRHAAKFLRPGGRLVSVMSAGIKFRSTMKAAGFREFLEERGATVEDLPAGAFDESGTSVNAVIVAFDAAATLGA